MVVTITKEFNWAMSHRLEGHKGLCKNLHGHNYRLFVTLKYRGTNNWSDSSSKGMVWDFKDFKNHIEIIIDPLDHCFAYNKNNKDNVKIAKFLQQTIKQKTHPFNFRVTTENLAKWIYKEINDFFLMIKIPLYCTKIVLYESNSSYATYEKSGDKK